MTTSHHRWFQFSLRTMFVWVTLAAIVAIVAGLGRLFSLYTVGAIYVVIALIVSIGAALGALIVFSLRISS